MGRVVLLGRCGLGDLSRVRSQRGRLIDSRDSTHNLLYRPYGLDAESYLA